MNDVVVTVLLYHVLLYHVLLYHVLMYHVLILSEQIVIVVDSNLCARTRYKMREEFTLESPASGWMLLCLKRLGDSLALPGPVNKQGCFSGYGISRVSRHRKQITTKLKEIKIYTTFP